MTSPRYSSFTHRRDAIALRVWERWVSGMNLDHAERARTRKIVKDATDREFLEGITDNEWLTATLARLNRSNVA